MSIKKAKEISETIKIVQATLADIIDDDEHSLTLESRIELNPIGYEISLRSLSNRLRTAANKLKK